MGMPLLTPPPTQEAAGETSWLDYYFKLTKFTNLLGLGPYISNDDTMATTVYPTWVSSSASNLPINISSGSFSFIPATGILYATGFDGTIGNVVPNTGKFTVLESSGAFGCNGKTPQTAASTVGASTTSGTGASAPAGGAGIAAGGWSSAADRDAAIGAINSIASAVNSIAGVVNANANAIDTINAILSANGIAV